MVTREIWDSHSGVAGNSRLLGCGAVLSGVSGVMNDCSAVVLGVKQGTAVLHNAVKLPMSVHDTTEDKDLQAVPFCLAALPICAWFEPQLGHWLS